MRGLTIGAVLLALTAGALAQAWQNGPTQPLDFRYTRFDGEYFPLNSPSGDTGMVYFLGGRLSTLATDSSVWRFNPRTGVFTDMGVDMPVAVSNYDICLLRDNYNLAAGDTYGLYIVGGRGSAGVNTAAVQVYYPRSNTVRVVTTDSFPGRDSLGRVYSAFNCVVVNNKLYLTGGAYLSGTPYTVVRGTWVYNPLAPAGTRWTQLTTADLPVPRCYINLCAVDSVIYAMGGDTVNQGTLPLNAVDACHRFDTRTPAAGWTAVAALPQVCGEGRAFGIGASAPYIFQNKVIVAGGGSWPAETAACYIYDVPTNTWSSFPPLDTARRNHAGVLIPGSPGQSGIPGLWVFGGRHLSDANIVGVPERYDIGVIPDVGVSHLLAPAGTVTIGTNVTPACSVYNYGNQTLSYPVRMRIGTAYSEDVTVNNHAPGTSLYVTFPTWTASPAGNYAVVCSTRAPGDLVAANNARSGSVEVVGGDVGTDDILAPVGLITPGTVVTPRARFRNHTAENATFNAYYVIRDAANAEVYRDSVLGLTLNGNSTVNRSFATWAANPVGTYTAVAWTVLAGDQNPANDTATASFNVNVVTAGTWTEVSQLPLPPSGKAIKDGGWLVEKGGRFFVAKGNKTADFYFCDADSLVWHQLTGIPLGAEAKAPGKGAAACGGDDDYIYCTKGNNTAGFWRYDIGAETWEQLPDVPLGPSNKKVKGGTDMLYLRGRGGDSNYVYLLKGYKSEFYRFNTQSLHWDSLPDAPAGAKPKWDKGSWIVARRFGNDSSLIYAHKAKYHELFTYNTTTKTWSSVSLAGMPLLSNKTGKSKKSKDGGSAVYFDDAIWALKGGNTAEFWYYDVSGDSWLELDTMPQVGSSQKKKRVKGGGDIVEYDDRLYALKGNKTLEFWMYTPGATTVLSLPERSGVMARPIAATGVLRVVPNPVVSGVATICWELPATTFGRAMLYDATGRLIVQMPVQLGRGTTAALDLRGLAAGVYLLRIESDELSAFRKLMVR